MNGAFSFIVILLLLLASCKPVEHPPVAKAGRIDASGWDFNTKGITPDGEWEFYWEQLYTPKDFRSTDIDKPDYITIPSNWPVQTLSGRKIPGHGYATYRLHIKGMPQTLLGIRMTDAYSNFKLWINDSLIATNGNVSNNPQSEETELRPVIKTFLSKGDNEMVVQVSNFYQNKGGLGTTPTFGTVDKIRGEWDIEAAINIFLVGMTMILFIYHAFIFLTTKNDYNSLWFSLVCLFTTARSLTTNERTINFVIPGMSTHLITRVEYATAFGALSLYAAFVIGFFPKDIPKLVKQILATLGIIQLLVISFTPVNFFTAYLTWYQVFALVQLIYLVITIFLVTLKKRALSAVMLFITIMILAAGVNDMLYARLVINTTFVLPYTLPVLFIFQAYMIAYRIGHALNSVENLSIELSVANQNLEQKVLQRTSELETETDKTDKLLLNIIPAEIAQELKEKGHSDPRTYSMVTVMFIKLTGNFRFGSDAEAITTLAEISTCFSAFDEIIAKHHVEKIKTIGDVYLCASGLPVPTLHHAENAVKAAVEIREFMAARARANDSILNMRTGATTGPVVAGIIGSRKFAYDIWGDTVNTSARLQQHCEPGMINISGQMHKVLKENFTYTHRGKIDAKNKGMIDMYYVN